MSNISEIVIDVSIFLLIIGSFTSLFWIGISLYSIADSMAIIKMLLQQAAIS